MVKECLIEQIPPYSIVILPLFKLEYSLLYFTYIHYQFHIFPITTCILIKNSSNSATVEQNYNSLR